MTERENFAAGAEARRAVPGKGLRADEPRREELLLRYLGAVASVSAKQVAAPRPTASGTAPAELARKASAHAAGAEPRPCWSVRSWTYRAHRCAETCRSWTWPGT